MDEPKHIFLFDGVCGLCDRTTRFVLDRDRRDRFRFAPLQSRRARELLEPHGRDPRDLDTVYVITADGRLYERSRAILFMLRELGGFWRVLSWFRVLPRVLTDAGYRVVAKTRYRIFGRLDECRLPSPAERAKFLDT